MTDQIPIVTDQMTNDGFQAYLAFLQAEPLLCLEWHDRESEAVGWLVVNSLTGGAAGGGTRMKVGGGRQEATFLAKTMETKFRVCGPVIGGAKSVIDFDPSDPRKPAVLRRFYDAISPFLRSCYGTAGDLNVDEIRDVVPITRDLGLAHPQEGIVRGHWQKDEASCQRIFGNLRRGIETPVRLVDMPESLFKVPDLVTGFGLSTAVKAYFDSTGRDLRGQRVLIEGFGVVGSSAAYYLHHAGAKIVGVVTRAAPQTFRWEVDAEGLDVRSLLQRRSGSNLPHGSPEGPEARAFWSTPADIFIPAAASETVDEPVLDRLGSAGVSILACGANVPFREAGVGGVEVQKRADKEFVVIPDFIANCGMARCFAYLMEQPSDLTLDAILLDTETTVRRAMEEVLGAGGRHGLLERALARYVPRQPRHAVTELKRSEDA